MGRCVGLPITNPISSLSFEVGRERWPWDWQLRFGFTGYWWVKACGWKKLKRRAILITITNSKRIFQVFSFLLFTKLFKHCLSNRQFHENVFLSCQNIPNKIQPFIFVSKLSKSLELIIKLMVTFCTKFRKLLYQQQK